MKSYYSKAPISGQHNRKDNTTYSIKEKKEQDSITIQGFIGMLAWM
jgi:hypothetical protein